MIHKINLKRATPVSLLLNWGIPNQKSIQRIKQMQRLSRWILDPLWSLPTVKSGSSWKISWRFQIVKNDFLLWFLIWRGHNKISRDKQSYLNVNVFFLHFDPTLSGPPQLVFVADNDLGELGQPNGLGRRDEAGWYCWRLKLVHSAGNKHLQKTKECA